MRKPDFCLYEIKGADELYSKCTADQHLSFCYTGSMILLPKYTTKFEFQTSSFFLRLQRLVWVIHSLSEIPTSNIETCFLLGGGGGGGVEN